MTAPTGKLSLPDDSASVLVLDPHDPTRLGLGLLLQRQSWVRRCLLARDLREATRQASEHRPDVAVVDVSNAGPFAASLLGELRTAHPGVQLVVASRCAASASLRMLPAAAVLPADAGAREIVRIVAAAVLGESTAPPLALRPPVPADRPVHLTERELEVLRLIGTGATNREIGAALHLGPDSIKKHATQIYRKLGVRNRTEATQRALELLEPARATGAAA